MSQIQSTNGFEAIRHVDSDDQEYWLARDIAPLLGYAQFRNFQPVIEKAREACRNSKQPEGDHFADMRKMVEIGSGAYRELEDVQLSRYACYLIVQNADPAKPIVAFGQTYFALQTRRQELGDAESFGRMPEDERRLAFRHELSEHNKALSAAAKGAGVETPIDYAIFQDHGYKGLYGGLGAKDLHNKRELKKSERILDHMGSTELAANLFRATQAEEKLKRENIKGKVQANKAHFEVGAKVRQTIKELGSTMPENLPTPAKSIKQIERERVKQLAAAKKGPLR